MCLWRQKSNAMEVAYNTARVDALNMIAEPVPLVIRNAPTKLMKNLNYGKGYQYAHDTEDKLTNMQCLPDSLLGEPTTSLQKKDLKRATRNGCSRLWEEWKRKHGAKNLIRFLGCHLPTQGAGLGKKIKIRQG